MKVEIVREVPKVVAPNNGEGLNLYVKHLPDDIQSEDLRELFSRFGPILSATVSSFNFIASNVN